MPPWRPVGLAQKRKGGRTWPRSRKSLSLTRLHRLCSCAIFPLRAVQQHNRPRKAKSSIAVLSPPPLGGGLPLGCSPQNGPAVLIQPTRWGRLSCLSPPPWLCNLWAPAVAREEGSEGGLGGGPREEGGWPALEQPSGFPDPPDGQRGETRMAEMQSVFYLKGTKAA